MFTEKYMDTKKAPAVSDESHRMEQITRSILSSIQFIILHLTSPSANVLAESQLSKNQRNKQKRRAIQKTPASGGPLMRKPHRLLPCLWDKIYKKDSLRPLSGRTMRV